MPRHHSLVQTYQERANSPGSSPLATYLLRLIAAKKTNLCVSADVSTSRELLQLAEEVGDSICLLKTHADIIHDWGTKTSQDLQSIARRKAFLIFEDRKFGDIGNTVQMQYTAGPLQIVRWANIVNAHIFPGPAIVAALASAAEDAVAAYNTSVVTQISGPTGVVPELEQEDPVTPDEPLITPTETHDDQDGDRLSSEDDDDDDDPGEPVVYSDEEDKLGDLTRHRSNTRPVSIGDDPERKFSVVSVSTTISTTTEQISPAPTPLHHKGMPHSFDGPSSPSQSAFNLQSSPGASGSHPDADAAVIPLPALGDPPTARGLLLLAQMSSAGNLMGESYTAKCVEVARQRPDFVLGFIAQRSLNELPGDNFITMTPGVNIATKGDALGQQYNSPEHVVSELGTDVVIVGRGIYAAQDRRAAAEEYRVRSWKAYEARVGGGGGV